MLQPTDQYRVVIRVPMVCLFCFGILMTVDGRV